MKNYKDMTVGQIVADNFDTMDVMNRFGIDFCCHGSDPFPEACKKAGVKMSEVEKALETVPQLSENLTFKDWPLDLLCDYVLKIYHRGIRREAPEIQTLLAKVCHVHGEAHPVLYEVQELFSMSVLDLYHHLDKEETVLFPYIYSLVDAEISDTPAPRMHCGTIAHPIEVMKMEHEAEGVRYERMTTLTGNYQAPEDACDSYKLVMKKLADFNRRLHEHIHIENNILFPEAMALETKLMSRENA